MAAKRQASNRPPRGGRSPASGSAAAFLRIIGGSLRGSKILYNGEPGTRPMKDRVRENVFNLLGDAVKKTIAFDLFAGTGAVAIEAISRGAVAAMAIERNFPMAETVKKNAAALAIADRVRVHAGDTFIWVRQLSPDVVAEWPKFAGDHPWTVFCCPPYCLYQDRADEMLALIDGLIQMAPAGSNMIVEADKLFDFSALPHATEWDVRGYPPAFVGYYRKP